MNVSITFTETWWYTWLLLPLLIMSARASDQAIGTLRVVFISKGMKLLAPAVGFVESIIWLLAVSQILKHVDNVFYFIAYGLGFALGNFIGITIEEKLSLGRVIVRIVSTKNTEELIDDMRENNFGLTVVEGHGSTTQIKLIFSVIARKHIKDLIELRSEERRVGKEWRSM